MDEYNLSMLVVAFSLFLIFLGFLIWGIKTGQFNDIEEAKYRMLEIDRPGRTGTDEPDEVRGEII
ncbi:cbb3-type cytochrome oxidase assembly protein [Methanolobus sediminis]|uniref:Cbb3-type cytochrome oxidase assembly protein n=1 Tax=Methanolobus sediminis TaxID=3072978 RepID=A0AA51UPS1_9EURY|nr:cbb3-type cytochrome oxidase assembly protein [Methanolobus sediminis]WMW26236.1 cbb3-type cytochrome oxidase assembly protein [Methanolobus sediminis]